MVRCADKNVNFDLCRDDDAAETMLGEAGMALRTAQKVPCTEWYDSANQS